MVKVNKRVRYDGISTVEGNYNTMHDKYLSEVEQPDGTTEQLADNIIAGNMLSQVDSEGHQYQVFTEVNDHKKDDSDISKVDGFIKSSSGNLHRKSTTRGWKILVKWKDGSVDWVPLKELKQSNPVDLAEYLMLNEIIDEPDFNWWFKENLKYGNRIISKVKSKYWHT